MICEFKIMNVNLEFIFNAVITKSLEKGNPLAIGVLSAETGTRILSNT